MTARSLNQVRFVYWLSRHWLLVFSLVWGLYVGLPWLAPVFMHLGWTGLGQALYLFYGTQCHQLPQRSFFLFGPQASYSLEHIQAVWQVTDSPWLLRQFVGSAEWGWKVAWSDRMVSMYTSMLFFGWLYPLVLRRWRPLPWWGFVLFILPMMVDGGTHMLSDLVGLGQGFRDTNAWLAALTGHALPGGFYAGDALGSFNSWMRLLTGLLFGLGTVWIAFPHLQAMAADVMARARLKLEAAEPVAPLSRWPSAGG